MSQYDYSKGFVIPISVTTVSRDKGRTGKPVAIHARLDQDFLFGAFHRQSGELMCGSPEGTGCFELNQPTDSVSCKKCRSLLDRWSRDAANSKCMGFAIARDQVIRAVAAKSNLFASSLLDIDDQVLRRSGMTLIDLKQVGANDGLDPIRLALNAHEYGAVLAQRAGATEWIVVKPSTSSEVSLVELMESKSACGNTRVSELRKNRTIRLSDWEEGRLKVLGGGPWIRARLNNAEKPVRPIELGAPVRTYSLRATDAEWKRIRELGGAIWIRSLIHRASEADLASGL